MGSNVILLLLGESSTLRFRLRRNDFDLNFFIELRPFVDVLIIELAFKLVDELSCVVDFNLIVLLFVLLLIFTSFVIKIDEDALSELMICFDFFVACCLAVVFDLESCESIMLFRSVRTHSLSSSKLSL